MRIAQPPPPLAPPLALTETSQSVNGALFSQRTTSADIQAMQQQPQSSQSYPPVHLQGRVGEALNPGPEVSGAADDDPGGP